MEAKSLLAREQYNNNIPAAPKQNWVDANRGPFANKLFDKSVWRNNAIQIQIMASSKQNPPSRGYRLRSSNQVRARSVRSIRSTTMSKLMG